MRISEIRNRLATGEYNLYLDVSGSFGDYSYAFLRKLVGPNDKYLDQLPRYVYPFSTLIGDRVSIKNFLKGLWITSGGTDFTVVFNHLVKSKYNKGIVFTDGYARIDLESLPKRKKLDFLLPKTELDGTSYIEKHNLPNKVYALERSLFSAKQVIGKASYWNNN